MESKRSITIEKIFDLQEKCFLHAIPLVKNRFSFIKECIEFLINENITAESLEEKIKGEFNIINSLKNIATSNIVLSTKLALYGAGIESLTLLRTAL